MKPTLLYVCALLAVAAAVPATNARIGETEEQCTARYGKPVEILDPSKSTGVKDPRVTANGYRFSNFDILVVFYDHMSQSETYSKADEHQNLDADEISNLLSVNSGGQKWSKVTVSSSNWDKDMWKTDDGSRLAFKSNVAMHPSLAVATQFFHNLVLLQAKQKADKDTGGF